LTFLYPVKSGSETNAAKAVSYIKSLIAIRFFPTFVHEKMSHGELIAFLSHRKIIIIIKNLDLCGSSVRHTYRVTDKVIIIISSILARQYMPIHSP